MVAVELEVLARKFDRFGWDRDRGSMAHDRIITDWMDALQDYPLEEVKAACRAAVLADPGKMPNEGRIVALIAAARARQVALLPALASPEPRPRREVITPERANQIMEEVGIRPRRFGGDA